ncbi:MAG: Spo0B domain-containing protein [Peptococcaceae bacterium]|nr:Spo0B domain-containing protein [Peptococcaceae bacterium]
MNTATFLEVMSIQRHDFLNHLQVISGLAQLNKIERVKEYVKQVSLEMDRLGKVARLMVPEVAAVLLAGHYLAEKHQVNVVYDIGTNLEDCAVPGNILAEVLEEAFRHSVACIARPGTPGCRLKVSIGESDRKYILKLSFPRPPRGKAGTVQARLAGAGQKMTPYGGMVKIEESGSGGEIFIIFPHQLPERGSLGT